MRSAATTWPRCSGAKRCAQRSANAATDPSALRNSATASFRMVRPATCSRGKSSPHIATYQALRTNAPVIIALLLRAGGAMRGFTFMTPPSAFYERETKEHQGGTPLRLPPRVTDNDRPVLSLLALRLRAHGKRRQPGHPGWRHRPVRERHAAWRPLASCLTASVVNGLPPMPHSPLATSEILTQVTPRMF